MKNAPLPTSVNPVSDLVGRKNKPLFNMRWLRFEASRNYQVSVEKEPYSCRSLSHIRPEMFSFLNYWDSAILWKMKAFEYLLQQGLQTNTAVSAFMCNATSCLHVNIVSNATQHAYCARSSSIQCCVLSVYMRIHHTRAKTHANWNIHACILIFA